MSFLLPTDFHTSLFPFSSESFQFSFHFLFFYFSLGHNFHFVHFPPVFSRFHEFLFYLPSSLSFFPLLFLSFTIEFQSSKHKKSYDKKELSISSKHSVRRSFFVCELQTAQSQWEQIIMRLLGHNTCS